MKKYLYVICLVAAFGSLISCSKNNDPAPDPLVGTWKLDRVRTSGFLAPYAANNGDNDPTVLDYQDTFITKVDKTFTGTVSTGGQVML